eukprot:gene13190-13321_t
MAESIANKDESMRCLDMARQALKAGDHARAEKLANKALKLYRCQQLALRLHPDKNKALKADEAFKLLSKAFSCLSNPDKRAYYDRTGYESSSAAAAAAPARRGGGSMGSTHYYYGADDFDPEEIFNMFFGGSAVDHVLVVGAGCGKGEVGGGRWEVGGGRWELLPVLVLIGITLLSGSSEPSYSLQQDTKYQVPLVTQRLEVVYYVKNLQEFQSNFPVNSHKRIHLERQVESDMYERMYQRCQNERMAQHRAFTWGNREHAQKMQLASCNELGRMNEKMNQHQRQHATVGGRY